MEGPTLAGAFDAGAGEPTAPLDGLCIASGPASSELKLPGVAVEVGARAASTQSNPLQTCPAGQASASSVSPSQSSSKPSQSSTNGAPGTQAAVQESAYCAHSPIPHIASAPSSTLPLQSSSMASQTSIASG